MAQQKNDQPLQTGSKARDDHRKQRGSKIAEYFWVVSLANISGIGWFKSYGKMLVAHGYIYIYIYDPAPPGSPPPPPKGGYVTHMQPCIGITICLY